MWFGMISSARGNIACIMCRRCCNNMSFNRILSWQRLLLHYPYLSNAFGIPQLNNNQWHIESIDDLHLQQRLAHSPTGHERIEHTKVLRTRRGRTRATSANHDTEQQQDRRNTDSNYRKTRQQLDNYFQSIWLAEQLSIARPNYTGSLKSYCCVVGAFSVAFSRVKPCH